MQYLLACHLRMRGGRLNVVQQLPLRMHSGILTEAAPAAGATPIVAYPVGLTPFNCVKQYNRLRICYNSFRGYYHA